VQLFGKKTKIFNRNAAMTMPIPKGLWRAAIYINLFMFYDYRGIKGRVICCQFMGGWSIA
jgi:hypothetical protein